MGDMMDATLALKRKLRPGGLCVCASITLTDPLVTEALAGSCDFIWIDLEHSNMSPEALQGHLMACRIRRVPGIVRLPGGDTHVIKPVLDAGAGGIIAPQVRSAGEVREIVADCYYAPLGRRGFGPRVPSDFGRVSTDELVARANESMFVAVMVENREAMEDLDAILAVPGLSAVIIGPMDLSGSLGCIGQLDHLQVQCAMDTIFLKAAAAGMPVGVGLGLDASMAARMFQRGASFVQYGCDYGYLIALMERECAEIGRRLGGDA